MPGAPLFLSSLSLSEFWLQGSGLFVLVLLADNSIYVTGYMPPCVCVCVRGKNSPCATCSQSALSASATITMPVVALNRQPGRQTCPAKCLVRIMQHKTHPLSLASPSLLPSPVSHCALIVTVCQKMRAIVSNYCYIDLIITNFQNLKIVSNYTKYFIQENWYV